GLKRILADNGPTSGITQVRLRISMIIFADGTAWRNGFLLNRDPNNPRRYIRIDELQSFEGLNLPRTGFSFFPEEGNGVDEP
ncbi:MAG TPA: hypothetical protein VFH15_13765, partial [Pyrinomonadaceae bacterium]|nr:hypothetical protein [Pyrinomonadaceae bacterium]